VNLPAETVAARLARVRNDARAAGIDALVVTHLPNLQYLTGFKGSAGAAVVLPRACLLVVDFRYVTAVTELTSALEGLVVLETFDRSYDEALVDVLLRERALRIGIEAAYLPVNRFNAISAGWHRAPPSRWSRQTPLPRWSRRNGWSSGRE
jgi:Xaa-Pro aminopeptidase